MKRSGSFFKNDGVSPIIAVIITVAITVIIASIAYVWFMSFTEDVGDTVIKPVSVSPDLNIERVQNELGLKVVIGKNVEWDNYRVMLNGTEVKTTAGKISYEGETVFFDYTGGRLRENMWYDLDIVDTTAQMVIFSDRIPALSYPPEGTGVYGFITSAHDGIPVVKAMVQLYDGSQLIETAFSDATGAYMILHDKGTYRIVSEVNRSIPETFGMEFETYSGNVTIDHLRMEKHDIVLKPVEGVNSSLQGYVYDNVTKHPIAGVSVRVTDNQFFQKQADTDASGFYNFSMPAGNISVIISLPGYSQYIEFVDMKANETKILDIYLNQLPDKTTRVFGYVYDKNGTPLSKVNVFLDAGISDNSSKTNESGYFEMIAQSGTVTFFVNTIDYAYWETIITLTPDEDYRLDIYLDKEA